MSEPVKDAPAAEKAEQPAAAKAATESKAADATAAAQSAVSPALEHVKTAAPGAGAEAEKGMKEKLMEAKEIAESTAGELKGAASKLSSLFGK